MSRPRPWGLDVSSVVAAAAFACGAFTKIVTTDPTPLGRALSAVLYHVTVPLLCAVLAASFLARRPHERYLAAVSVLMPFGFGYNVARVRQLQDQYAVGSHMRASFLEVWPRVAGAVQTFLVLSALGAVLAAVLAWVARQGRGYAATVWGVLALLGATEVGMRLEYAHRETIAHPISHPRLDPVTTSVEAVLLVAALAVIVGLVAWAIRNRRRRVPPDPLAM